MKSSFSPQDLALAPVSMMPEACSVLESFEPAHPRHESHCLRLEAELLRLAGELEATNLELRRNRVEKGKMQAILISALQSLTVGVLAVGQDGVIIVANPAACELIGQPVEQVAGQSLDELLEPIAGSESLFRVLQGAGPARQTIEWTPDGPDGRPRIIELTAVRAAAPYDLHLAGLILAADRTDWRRLEEQAALRNRLTGMGEIAMTMAHELRNPLGSVTLFATALERELAGDDSLGPLASQIVAGVRALEHIVANTLEFARPRRMTMTRVNLAGVIDDALGYVEHPLGQKGIRLERYGANDAWVLGDAEQLRQVFLNLFINAIQAMGDDGMLRVTLERGARGEWIAEVADTGDGIDAARLPRIFDPFYTTKEKGSGIGLSVVHTILCAHGARVEVQSRKGEGSVFRVMFEGEEEGFEI